MTLTIDGVHNGLENTTQRKKSINKQLLFFYYYFTDNCDGVIDLLLKSYNKGKFFLRISIVIILNLFLSSLFLSR